jgi:large subunit ribosomal protein L25
MYIRGGNTMSEFILKATDRVDNPTLLRKSGFIPGVLYGEGFEKGIPVKFEEPSFIKLVHIHGPSAKVWIEFNGNRHFGFIKEIQRNCVSGKIIHSDIHMLSQNDDIRIKLPIIFTGVSELEHKSLLLQIQMSKIDVSGKAGILPEHITLNVEHMKLGDTVKAKDLNLSDAIKVHDPANEIYAVVTEMKGAMPEEKAEATQEVK